MIDNTDIASSTIKLLTFEAIKRWNTDSIIQLLSDKDYIVRTMAARELQKRGDLHIFTEVIKLTESNVIYEREISAFILGQLGTPNVPFKDETIPVLNRLSLDTSEEVSVSAICGIGHLCSSGMPKDTEELLIKLSDSYSDEVKKSVAFALGKATNNSQVISTLNKLLKDPNNTVSEFAVLGLDLLSDKTKQ